MTNSKWFGNSDADPVGDLMRRLASVEAYANDLERKIANFDSPQPLSRVDPVTYRNPFEGQRAIDPADEQHMWYSNGEWRKAGGFGIYEIKVFDDITAVTTGDDKFIWPVPHELDDAQIVEVEAAITTVGSGTTTIAIRKGTAGTAGTDILSTNITIDSGEYNSKDAATQPVVVADTIATWGQHLHIDVNTVGSGAMGLVVIVTLVPSNLASIVLEGAQGPAGGITQWTGQWVTSTSYTQNQSVSNNGSSYAAIDDHTSGASTEPGVGADWEDHWQLLSEGFIPAADGWVDTTATTWTWASGTTFTVSGDQTAVFTKGTRLKLTQTTGKFFVVVGSSHSAGTTTVTVTAGDDYSLANAAITDNYYSYQANPQGFPTWFAYTPSIVAGFSGTPTVSPAQFSVIGNACIFQVSTISGTSNATSFQISAPITATGTGCAFGTVINSGSAQSTPGQMYISGGTLFLRLNAAGAGFTASGTKGLDGFGFGQLTYKF